jgi:putative peptidoglycan lipid II flippase
MIPAIFGSAVYQFNSYIGMLLASTLQEGSVSWLYYADRLIQFPLGIFGIAISTAALPTLSAQVAGNQTKAFEDTLSHSLRMVFFITIPAMAGLIVLGEPIIRIIFERGKFDAFSTSMTQLALIYYTVGLWAFSCIRIVVSAFYAYQDTKTPVKVAVIAAILNIFFSLILMRFLQHGGLALALSLASSIQLCLLILFLKRRLPEWDLRPIINSTLKSLAASLIMGVVIYFFNTLWLNSFWTSAGLLWQIFVLAVFVGGGICIYFLLTRLFRSPELGDFLKLIKPS